MAPAPPVPPRKNTVTALVIGAVVLVILIVIAFGIVTAFRSGKNAITSATTIAKQFMADMGAHNYTGASELSAPDAKSKMSPSALKSIETAVEQRRGAYLAPGACSWMLRNYNGQSYVQLAYGSKYTEGTVGITLVLIDTSQSYRVDSFNYAL